MAKIDPRHTDEHEVLLGFGGVRSRDRLSQNSASRIRNFRILSDGSLEKRCGTRVWYSLPDGIRGTWEGTLGGKSYFFAVAGDTVYCIKPAQSAPVAVYVLTTASGHVSFVFYRDRLYLLDGKSLLYFRTNTETFQIAEGYTPLYGRNWHPTELGSIHEPLNMVQNRIRIHYLNTTGSTTFRLPFTTKQIDSLKINGSYVTSYSFTPYTSTFTIPPELAGGSVDVAVTLDEIFSRRAQVLRAYRAMVYKDPYHETFLSFGGAPGYFVYRSGKVSDSMLAESTAIYGASDALYIPYQSAFTVGSVQAPITAMLQCGEQTLVFNKETLWAIRHADRESDEMQILLLRQGLGCLTEGGAVNCGEDIVTLQENGILRLRFPTSDPDECVYECISEEIGDKVSNEWMQRAILFWNSGTNELWIKSFFDSGDLIWIYHPSSKQWICFDGLPACCFFRHDGGMGYGSETGKLVLFDEALTQDNGVSFSAEYIGQFMTLAHPELYKRALRASLCADSGGNAFFFELSSERRGQLVRLQGQSSSAPELFDLRMSLGRFRFLRFRIYDSGGARSRFYFLKLAGNKP